MSAAHTPNQNSASGAPPALCLNNCGFFGSPKTQGYCSKCFKEVSQRQAPSTASGSASAGTAPPSLSPASPPPPAPPAAAAALPIPVALASPQASPAFAPVSSSAPVPSAALDLMAAQRRGAAAAAAADGSVSNEASPSDKAGSAKKKNRCAMCSKKVGVMGFECRCDQVFCAEHRYPHVHNCAFDVKALTKSNIAKANPKVQESKIDKL